MVKSPKQFEVYLAALDPTLGKEIKKTRPCLIVSPDEMNEALHTVLAAPMTTQGFLLPCRLKVEFQKKKGLVLLDQMRCLDRHRLVKRLGVLNVSFHQPLHDLLVEMFS